MENQIGHSKNVGENFAELKEIVEKIRKCHIVESVEIDCLFNIIEINYKTNLQVCEEIFDYTLEDWNENSPESFIIEGFIKIYFCENNIDIVSRYSSVLIYDCNDMRGNSGDIEGYELDNLINKDNLLEYLKELLANLELVKGDEIFDEIEAVFFTETGKDLFNNEYLFIGKKTTSLGEQYYYKIEDNSSENTNLVGREYWKKIDSGFFDVNTNGKGNLFVDADGIEISIYDYFKPYLKTEKHIELLESLKE